VTVRNAMQSPSTSAIDHSSLHEGEAMPKAKDDRDDPLSTALKKLHDSVVDEPLPDEFMDLLDQIDRKIAAKEAQK
jgi:Anti-sigma factor NepR